MSIDRPQRASPLFIVGSPRSGTSVLVDAAFVAGFKGFREGNLLGLLRPIRDQVDSHFRIFGKENPRVLASHVRPQMIYGSILEVFRQTLEALNPEGPWVDKSCNSSTILVLPDLVSLWPDCRILFAKRRGIENILSRMKKFPERDFSYHCRDWASNMSAWRSVRERLEPWRYREIDQRDLIERPDVIAGEIAQLLALDAAAQARMKHVFVTLRPQQTAPGTADQVTSLQDAGWTDKEVEEFSRICGPEMECFGYTLDRTYRKSTAHGAP